ncbi:inactive protein RESTRICTED TEV MOVEMENT 2-like [Salvia divinorum]|uniref:Inactive protein RESTRICTED TEV MOVEMENT 2-like n=1 Tax=Salvia divinorum TaxID=28513 RepID=A0ABD1H9L8_SALDI
MDSSAAISTFEPSFDLIQEEDCNTLLLYLPGFAKEQLKVQLTRTRVVKISGQVPLPNNRWSSFQKDFPVPENCDTNKITAKFEEGILYVRLPKEETKLAPAETPQPHKPAVKLPTPPIPTPQAPAAKIDPPPPPARPPTPIRTPKASGEIKQSSAPKESAEKPAQSGEEARPDKKRREADGGDRRAEKREKGSGSGGGSGKVESDYNKLSAVSPAARLKAARQQIKNIAVLLFVFGLGIYVSKLPWFSRRAQE